MTFGEPERPPRPYLPPSFAAALTCMAGSAIIMQLLWLHLKDGILFLVIACVGCLLAVFLLLLSRMIRRRCRLPYRGVSRYVAAASTGLLFSVLACSCAWAVRSYSLYALEQASMGSVRVEVVSDSIQSMFGFSAQGVVRAEHGRALGRVVVSSPQELGRGQMVSAVYRLEALGDSDFERSLFMKGVCAKLRIVHVKDGGRPSPMKPLERLRAHLLKTIDPASSPSRALIAGVLCGRTTELAQLPENDDFSRAGLSHLVAVSGSHLTYISSLVGLALARVAPSCRLRRPFLMVVLGLYVLFTGGAPSAVRSAVMVGCSMLCAAGGRRGHAVSGLSIACIVLVLLRPGTVFDLGFQLSAMSVLFILCFSSYLSYVLCVCRVPRALADALSVTFCALWGTLPASIPVFGTVSLISPISNLFAAGPMSALLLVSLVAVPLASFGPLSPLLMALPDALARVSIFIASTCARIPFASVLASPTFAVVVLPCMAAVILFALWPHVRRRLCIVIAGVMAFAACSFVGYWRFFAPASVCVMDVGQADSILMRDRASAMLFDAGVDDSVLQGLARQHVFHLDAVLITHWDKDHCGGLGDVLANVKVDKLMVARGATANMPSDIASLDLPPIEEVDASSSFSLGRFACDVQWPQPSVSGNENGDSLVVRADYADSGKKLSVLLTGDAERRVTHQIEGTIGDIDVLKLGHHGSAESVDAELLRAIDPEVAVASAGVGNSYGHPTARCRQALRDYGCRFFCTTTSGDVTVKPGREGRMIVHCAKRP